jgi:hypothetical protein
VSVAGFGYDDGETSWLENAGGGRFTMHVLQRLSGGINAVPADVDGDGRQDILTLVSQEWEEIWAFVNGGGGRFTPRLVWGLDQSRLRLELDLGGRPGSRRRSRYPVRERRRVRVRAAEQPALAGRAVAREPRAVPLRAAPIIALQGATSPQAADLDGDGDLDVVIVTANNDWNDPKAPSLVWLENDGRRVHAARRGVVADAFEHRGRGRPGRRRPARARGRRHAHLETVRSLGRVTLWTRPR